MKEIELLLTVMSVEYSRFSCMLSVEQPVGLEIWESIFISGNILIESKANDEVHIRSLPLDQAMKLVAELCHGRA